MTAAKEDKTTSTEHDKDPETITADDVKEMQQIFDEAKRVVKPIVKRELAAEVVSGELLNVRLKHACRTLRA